MRIADEQTTSIGVCQGF